MLKRLGILALAALAIPACGGGGDDDPNGLTYRTTYGYYLTTGQTSLTGTLFYLMSSQDVATYQTHTGVTQNAGLGIIVGKVQDGSAAGIAGVTIQAHNDAGLSAGGVFYQNATTGAYSALLTETQSTGWFVAMNVTPGRVNLKCAAGAGGGAGTDGNLYLDVKADSCVFAVITATSVAKSTVTWAGQTLNLGGTGTALPGAAEASVTYTRLGHSGSTGPSDGTGLFNLGSVNAENTFLVRCSKAGLVDTYNTKVVGTSNLTGGAGGGDLLIVSPTNRDNELKPAAVSLTAGTGIIRGEVINASGGFTVEARDAAGTLVGEVWYGDNANFAKPSAAVTSTQADGVFYIYNVPPGQVLVRALKTGGSAASATTYVDVFADSISLPADLVPVAQSQDTISISGALVTMLGYGIQTGSIGFVGLAGVGATSDSFNGAYVMSGVPARHVLIARTSK